jgi:hypothetical protein
MDSSGQLDTVDNRSEWQEIALRHLANDMRVRFQLEDGAAFLQRVRQPYDFIFADTWPGKFDHLDLALGCFGPEGSTSSTICCPRIPGQMAML